MSTKLPFRKKDLRKLSYEQLVELVWQIAKDTNETARIFGTGYEDPFDLCVITAHDVFDRIEEAVAAAPHRALQRRLPGAGEL